MSERFPWEFNGVVRLTKTGIAYILSTIVLAVAAINTGNNALYIAVSIMLGCLLLSGLASKGGLRQLSAQIGGLEEAWAGRPATGELRIVNHSRIWTVRDVVITSDVLEAPVVVPVVPRKSEVSVSARFVFPRRGVAHVSVVDSYTRYPFGFILKKRRLRVESEVIVYPRLLPEEMTREGFRPVTGEQSSVNRPGIGTEVHSFRDYVRGDSLRQVHWKKSASLGRWIMKQQEAEAGRSVHVVVDTYKPQGATDDDFEHMVSSAATFIYHALGRELDVTLSLPRLTLRARESEPGGSLFRALALVAPTYEPVHLILERDAVMFAVTGAQHDAKSA